MRAKDILESECHDCYGGSRSGAKLECDHSFCKSCLIKHAFNAFMEEENFSFKITCRVCGKLSKISNTELTIAHYMLRCKCQLEINDTTPLDYELEYVRKFLL